MKNSIQHYKELLQPITFSDFSSNYWENKFLHLERENKNYYKNLFSIKVFDSIIEYGKPRGKSLRVVRNQEPLLPTKYEKSDGSINLNQLYAAYSDGYTLVINEIQKYSESINRLVHNMRQQLSHNVKANAYLTPANQKALAPHYDTHDVFVLQISGEKHWNFYDDTSFKTPLLNSFQPIFKETQLSEKKEITIKAGDLMYIPRGMPHDAHTTDESSLHLTIGIYPTQHVDLYSKAIQSLAQSDIDLRKALPIGFLNYVEADKKKFIKELSSKFRNSLEKIFEENSLDNSLFIIHDEFRNEIQPKSDGHFAQLDKIADLTIETKLIKRENMPTKVLQQGPYSRIIFPGNVIKGPVHIAPCFDFIANAKYGFRVEEIPLVNDANKIKLCKRLVRGGLLKFNDLNM